MLGPRQVGKTVLLLQVVDDLLEAGWPAQNITYFDFSDDRLTKDQPIHPRDIVNMVPQGHLQDHPRALLFDEVRRAENWELWLKNAVDAEVGRIAVTDSAASLARRETVETGMGRWDEHRLEGLSFREFLGLVGMPGSAVEETLQRIPNVTERFLQLGGFPEHARSDDEAEVRARLRSAIVDKAILRDLLQFGIEVERAKDLFVYLVQESGGIFVAKARAGDVDADPRTVGEWLRLLGETMLVVQLPRFTGRASVSLRSHPKIYAADHGIIRAFASAPWSEEDLRWRVFEAAVFRHLRECATTTGATLGYYRDSKGRSAVDFVFELEAGLTLIEVTSSARVDPRKLQSLRKVGALLKTDRLVLIHGGGSDEVRDDVQVMPLPRFLLNPEHWLGLDP